MNFTTWKEQKKVQNRDLLFLDLLKTEDQLAQFNILAERMASYTPSFSEGLVFLETAVELILMGHNEDIFQNSTDFSSWAKNLKQLRYPLTTGRENETKLEFERLTWPAGAKLKFERRGDRFGAEMKCFITNSSDVLKLNAALERLYAEMKKNESL